MAGGLADAFRVINELASCGLFRVKDVKRLGLSYEWLDFAKTMRWAVPRGRGVWSHPDYVPSRYELVQVRFPRAVFWGPSALWLLGALAPEPDLIWLAVGNKIRVPRTLEPGTVIIRTRHLETALTIVDPPRNLMRLRVHSRERALADIARRERRHPALGSSTVPPDFKLPADCALLTGGPGSSPGCTEPRDWWKAAPAPQHDDGWVAAPLSAPRPR